MLGEATAERHAVLLEALRRRGVGAGEDCAKPLHAERLLQESRSEAGVTCTTEEEPHEAQDAFRESAERIGQARIAYDKKLGEVEMFLLELTTKIGTLDARIEQKFITNALGENYDEEMSARESSHLSELAEAEANLQERVGVATALLEEQLGEETPTTEAGLIEAAAKLSQAKLGLQEQFGIVMAHLDEKLGEDPLTPRISEIAGPSYPRLQLSEESLSMKCIRDSISGLEDRLNVVRNNCAETSAKLIEAEARIEERMTSCVKESVRQALACDETQASLDERVRVVEKRLENRPGASNQCFEVTP